MAHKEFRSFLRNRNLSFFTLTLAHNIAYPPQPSKHSPSRPYRCICPQHYFVFKTIGRFSAYLQFTTPVFTKAPTASLTMALTQAMMEEMEDNMHVYPRSQHTMFFDGEYFSKDAMECSQYLRGFGKQWPVRYSLVSAIAVVTGITNRPIVEHISHRCESMPQTLKLLSIFFPIVSLTTTTPQQGSIQSWCANSCVQDYPCRIRSQESCPIPIDHRKINHRGDRIQGASSFVSE